MIDIKDLLREELSKEFELLGIERFRVNQIFDWTYKKYVSAFDKMTNLSIAARNLAKEKFYISSLELERELISKDGTRKFLFKLEDGEKVESVFIPSKKTNTVCISSQVGCKFACRFCASGSAGFVRNLRPAEMLNQILTVKCPSPQPSPRREEGKGEGKNSSNVTNVVFMGMGEPLDNYDNVIKAIRILNAPYSLGIGQRKITISTCGIVPAIKKLAEEGLQVELSISLHGPDDKTRSGLMAVNKKYPLKELMAALEEYIRRTNRQVTFEYVLIKGVNDAVKHAEELSKLLKGMLAPLEIPSVNKKCAKFLTGLAKVNLIVFNPVEGLDYLPPEKNIVRQFKDILDKKGVVSTIRLARGTDIEAACGQLRLKNKGQ